MNIENELKVACSLARQQNLDALDAAEQNNCNAVKEILKLQLETLEKIDLYVNRDLPSPVTI